VRPVLAVAFSPDSTTLASAGEDNMINLWNVQDRHLLDSLSDTRTPSQASRSARTERRSPPLAPTRGCSYGT
jgi:WD40 repeat protein